MNSEPTPPESAGTNEFVREAEQGPPGVFREFVIFLRYYGKWWLIPIILLLVLVGAVVLLSAGPAAPFIYTLF